MRDTNHEDPDWTHKDRGRRRMARTHWTHRVGRLGIRQACGEVVAVVLVAQHGRRRLWCMWGVVAWEEWEWKGAPVDDTDAFPRAS